MNEQEFIKKLYTDSSEFRQFYDHELPDIVGNEAVSHFKDSFQDEGFTDETLEPWPEVKRRVNPPRVDRAAATRKILTGNTGDLGRSIEYKSEPDQVRITADTASVGSSKSYAAAHNEGTTNAGRGNRTTIPKRQFIGRSATLNRTIEDITEKRIITILRK